MSRPRNIGIGQLMHYRFPLTAIASIGHRLSGFIMVLFIPFVLWVWGLSLHSPRSFALVQAHFEAPWARLLIWVLLSALLYHMIAGIKHLLMDCGWFETKEGGKASSLTVMVLAAIGIIGLGVWLW